MYRAASERYKSSKKLLMALVNANGKTWGMSPWSARYYYLTMVRSAISYLSFIWHHVCRLTSVQDKLKSFQCLAFKVMGPMWPGTPTRELEMPGQTTGTKTHGCRTISNDKRLPNNHLTINEDEYNLQTGPQAME